MFTKACLSLSLIVSLTTLASAQTQFGPDRNLYYGRGWGNNVWGYGGANTYNWGANRGRHRGSRHFGRTDHPVNWGNYEAVGVRRRGWGGYAGGYSRDQGGSSVTYAMRNESFTRDLWTYLTSGSTAYKNWDAFPGKDPRMQASQDPHGPNVLTYANHVVQSRPGALPDQSIIILENYAEDAETLETVDVMYRYSGFDPTSNDWYWVRYSKIGAVALASPKRTGSPLAGRVNSCIRCHANAGGDDFVYSND